MFKTILKKIDGDSISAILAKGVSASAVIMIVGKALSYATNIAFVRLCGPVEYGVYVYYMAWIGIAAVVVRLGMDTVLLRFLPQYHVEQNWPLLKGIIRKCHVLVTQIILMGIVLILLFCWLGWIDRTIIRSNYILLSLCIVWLLANITLLQSSMRAMGALVSALVPDMVCRPILMILFAVSYYFFSIKITSFDLLLINATSLVVTFLVLTVFFVKQLPIQCRKISHKYKTTEWLRVGFPFLLLSGINLVMNKTDLIMVGIFLEPEKVGIYSACVDLTSIVLFALTATSMVMVPMLSRLFSSGEYDKIRVIMKISTKILALIAIVAFFGLVIFGKVLLNLYDKIFIEGYIPMLILSFGFSVNVSVGMVGALLNMGGREKIVTKTVAACGGLNVLLNWILIPKIGLHGAALATAISMIIWNIILYFYVNKKFLPNLGMENILVIK